jgi:hypothetical protein
MDMASINVELRNCLRNQTPGERALTLMLHAPHTPICQIIVDSIDSNDLPSIQFGSGTHVYIRDGATLVLSILSAGPLHAVYDKSNDEILWLLGTDLQAGVVRQRRGGKVPELVSGPWLKTWIITKLGLDAQCTRCIDDWLILQLKALFPTFDTLNDLEIIKPSAEALKTIADQLVSPMEILNLQGGLILCRLQVPNENEWFEPDADFCSPEGLCATLESTKVVVLDTKSNKWKKATLKGHTNGAVTIQLSYGGESHLQLQIPYTEAHRVSKTLSTTEAAAAVATTEAAAAVATTEAAAAVATTEAAAAVAHQQPRQKKLRVSISKRTHWSKYGKTSNYTSKYAKKPNPSVKLPSITELFAYQRTPNERLIISCDFLPNVLGLIESDDAFLVALTCRAVHHVFRRRFPQGFVTAIATSKERVDWAIYQEPRVRRVVAYAAGASGNLPVLVYAVKKGLPFCKSFTDHIIEVPWREEYALAGNSQTHIASLSEMNWPQHLPDPKMGVVSSAEYERRPQLTFIHIAAEKGHLPILQWASRHGYKFDSEVLRMALRGGCTKSIEFVTACLPSAAQGLASYIDTEYFVDVAKKGDMVTLSSFILSLRYMDDPIIVPLAALNAGHYDLIEWLIQNELTKGIAAAAAAFGDHQLLTRAIDAGWSLKYALTMAAKQGDCVMVKRLLNQKPLSETLASVHAATQGHTEILKMLKGGIHYASAQILSIAAISGGHLDLRDNICDHYHPDSEELQAAARFGCTQMIKDGLPFLIPEDFYLVQSAAAAAGNLGILQLMDSRPPASEAWELAAANGHLHILKFLVTAGYIPSHDTWQLILAAAARINDRETIVWAKHLGYYSTTVVRILSLYGYEAPKMVPEFISI